MIKVFKVVKVTLQLLPLGLSPCTIAFQREQRETCLSLPSVSDVAVERISDDIPGYSYE